MKAESKRIELLDELRGFAIVAMIIHHTFLAIGDVTASAWGYEMFNKLCVVQPVFWGIFIIISGICTRLSRNPVKRGAIVLGAGMTVTLVTAVIMPLIGMDGAQIYFGILHCLGCCMIITGLLMPIIEKINPIGGMLICAVLFAITYNISSGSLLFGLIAMPEQLYQTNYLMPIGIYNQSFYSADYFAIFPWIFMFQFGAFFGKYAKDGAFPQWTYKKHSRFFGFVGRNSLWFYLGHQVVIYGILYLIIGICLLKQAR
ncbi:MAG: heparan-alpha-glucosaminide N-acetyltransferase [Eubacterium sp.]